MLKSWVDEFLTHKYSFRIRNTYDELKETVKEEHKDKRPAWTKLNNDYNAKKKGR